MNPMLIIGMVLTLIDGVAKIRKNLQQSGEWTPEEEAKFQEMKEAAYKAEHWQVR